MVELTENKINVLLLEQFPYTPTRGQKELISKLAGFVISDEPNSLFVMRGYAGTGKTSIVSALVKVLPAAGQKAVLLAPTGRAAKVLSNYSGQKAYTIHKKIYRIRADKFGKLKVALQDNLHKSALFIVDEASMIPGTSGGNQSGFFSGASLREDLLEYVSSGYNCRVMFIGDTAQLPPVGSEESPALDVRYLKTLFSYKIRTYELNEVVRQEKESGILKNATDIRNKIASGETALPYFSTGNYPDIIQTVGTELEDALNDGYSTFGTENVAIITRSNKRANIYNREIRNRILFRENEIAAGDLMMVVKNNYFWLPKGSETGFIANGDIIEILKVKNITEIYGFHFGDVTIRLVDYPDEKDMDVILLLDTIMAEKPSLGYEENKKLFDAVMEDYEEISQKRERIKNVKKNPFFNALQVKFAYALTCHKTQGGQWDCVFVEQGYVTNEMIDKEYLRWLYTALTRATQKLHLVNFHSKFFTE